MLILSGGHGFRMHADTVLLEIKQGPFIEQEKDFWPITMEEKFPPEVIWP